MFDRMVTDLTDGLTPKPRPPNSGDAKASKKKLPKYPRPLRKEIVDAIENLERWLAFEGVKEDAITALREYRSNVHMGILSPFYVQKYSDDTDILGAFYRLDKAFQALHDYDPKEYLTRDMLSLAGNFNKNGKVSSATQDAKEYLRSVSYLDAPRGPSNKHGTKGFYRALVTKKIALGTFHTVVMQLRDEKLISQKATEK